MLDVILSHFQTRILLQARALAASAATLSCDLGLSATEATLSDSGVSFPGGEHLAWADVAHIDENPQACFRATAVGIEKIQIFSEDFNRLYSLMPTAGAPTMLISGIPMHRIKAIDPMEDTRRKIRATAPRGHVLDTATGLGYTAILAARTATLVTTIELAPAALEIARQNPWSRELFSRPNIAQLIGDSFDLLSDFPDASFDRVVHDPPMFNLAGHLYSAEFYRRLLRVLKANGRLYHYIGDPNSKSGRNTTAGVVRRLREAGFERVVRKPQAFGVLAFP